VWVKEMSNYLHLPPPLGHEIMLSPPKGGLGKEMICLSYTTHHLVGKEEIITFITTIRWVGGLK